MAGSKVACSAYLESIAWPSSLHSTLVSAARKWRPTWEVSLKARPETRPIKTFQSWYSSQLLGFMSPGLGTVCLCATHNQEFDERVGPCNETPTVPQLGQKTFRI
jgi:hypothetical protein